MPSEKTNHEQPDTACVQTTTPWSTTQKNAERKPGKDPLVFKAIN